MCSCLKAKVKVEVEDHQELEIKHFTKGTKIGNNEVLAFIKCKHCEHVAQKEMVDPRMHMGPTM
jgi:hypothetical protein